MNRRVTIVAVTAGLLVGVPTAAWADQKPASSVVSNQKYNLASYFDKGDNRNNGNHWGRDNDNDNRWGNHWGRDHDNGNHWGWGHDDDDHGHGHHGGGDKSHGC